MLTTGAEAPVFKTFNDRFKLGTFFVSSIILGAKHELTSKSILLDRSFGIKNNEASDAV